MSTKTKIAKTPERKREKSISQTGNDRFSKSTHSTVEQILHLQRTIGNQAVQRLFKSGVIQAKLGIGQPGDIYEQEADRIAAQVMRMPEPAIQPTWAAGRPSCRDEESVQTKPLSPQITPLIQRQEDMEEEEEPVQTKGISGRTQQKREDLHTRLSRNRGGGQPLPEAGRSFMERRFGADFRGVRVHTDSNAVQMNRELNAQAFTYGRDIYFGAGRYNPGTSAEKRLLAHELTHTIQQRNIPDKVKTIKRSICPSACRATVRRGNLCRGSSVTRDNCGNRNAVNNSNKISHIRVLLGPQRVHLFWNGTPRTDLGTNEEFGCHPNARLTPRGWDTVGRKCGENHTSWSRYHMAWFTEFRNTEMSIGFHNSQPLSGGPSHGCVRVSCEDANKINQNSVSNWTSIMVR